MKKPLTHAEVMALLGVLILLGMSLTIARHLVNQGHKF